MNTDIMLSEFRGGIIPSKSAYRNSIYSWMPIIEPSFTASLQLPDGSADEEFGGQHSATEGHLRVMQALEQHLHTRFADLLFMDANGGKRGIHQNSFFTIVETDQANLVRHFHTAPG